MMPHLLSVNFLRTVWLYQFISFCLSHSFIRLVRKRFGLPLTCLFNLEFSRLLAVIYIYSFQVLIEAVENHMPQVIVIDEISTKLEAMAASTIAQRGIQLVATAHGVTIENLIMNPALEMLVGGIQVR